MISLILFLFYKLQLIPLSPTRMLERLISVRENSDNIVVCTTEEHLRKLIMSSSEQELNRLQYIRGNATNNEKKTKY